MITNCQLVGINRSACLGIILLPGEHFSMLSQPSLSQQEVFFLGSLQLHLVVLRPLQLALRDLAHNLPRQIHLPAKLLRSEVSRSKTLFSAQRRMRPPLQSRWRLLAFSMGSAQGLNLHPHLPQLARLRSRPGPLQDSLTVM